MIDVNVFLDACAKVMAFERPDIFDYQRAYNDVSGWFSELADAESGASTGTGGYLLQKDKWDGVEEYSLNRQILTYNVYREENETDVFDWTTHSAALNIGLDIPNETLDND